MSRFEENHCRLGVCMYVRYIYFEILQGSKRIHFYCTARNSLSNIIILKNKRCFPALYTIPA